MGGEGSMMAANSSLKTNRGQLSKRKEKKGLEGSYAGIELKEFPKATEEQIQAVRDNIKAQNRKTQLRSIIAFCILIVILVLLFTLL
ncbi:hypothetical protein [Hyunsoonleella ulvae]|uniref:hypothetical protein n=1 Tax=Hyunsoonleella ulvae TaxID=2799948 RepID=UPI00193970EB|nr:hypothetical protein [Hyunsoonleella ulvae]